MISAEITAGFDDLPLLREPWEAMYRARANEPSTSFEWTAAMSRHHVKSGDRCYLVRLLRDSEIVGVVPLVARRVPFLKQDVTVLAPLSDEYNTHSDLLLSAVDETLLEALVKGLARIPDWDMFRMGRLLAEGPLTLCLHRVLQRTRMLHHVRSGLAAYVLDLPDSYETYLSARSAKFRNHLKRTIRKIESLGEVAVHYATDADSLAAGYDAVLEVERKSWKQDHGSSIVVVARQTGFYREMCFGALQQGRLHLQWLTIDGQPAAYNMGIVDHGGYHYLKTSYDAALRAASPATYLRARLIADLIERGVTRLDFPGEPYEWESQWTTDYRRRAVLTVYPRTIRGWVLYAIEKGRQRWRPDADGITHVDARAYKPKLEAAAAANGMES